MSHHSSRLSSFRSILSQPHIDLDALRSLAYDGIPEEHPELRSTVWKLLLRVLPPTTSEWDAACDRKQAQYRHFCQEFTLKPSTTETSRRRMPQDVYDVQEPSRMNVTHGDHPLSTHTTSRWNTYFADVEIHEQIERDVDRTHPDLHFFRGQSSVAKGHRAAMCRALFVFAKLNPGLRYVQGMNELFAILYHTFANGNKDLDKREYEDGGDLPSMAETASFFAFVDLMGEFRDHFCSQLDNSDVGIRSSLSKLSSSLRAFDSQLWTKMEVENGVKPHYYAFRWMTTLLTQEFSFPDVVRLWDTMLSDPDGRSDCIRRLCIAMVLLVKDELMAGDFAANMRILQQYPPMDVGLVVRKANEIRNYKSVFVLD